MSEGMVIPKSYKNTTEKKFGMSYAWLIMASITVLVSGFLALLIMFSHGIDKIILYRGSYLIVVVFLEEIKK